MERGRFLADMARKISYEGENMFDKNKFGFKYYREERMEPIPNETQTSFDVGAINSTLLKLRQYKGQMIEKVDSQSQSEEDDFHETDFDDSDYIPSDSSSNSELNITSECVQAMANVLESNMCNDNVSELDKIDLFTSNSSLKNGNKLKKNLGLQYVTYKNKTMPARKTQELGMCRLKCHTKINFEQQTNVFEAYWSLGEYNKRRQFLSNLIEVQTKKTKSVKMSETQKNRKFVYLYHFGIHGIKTRVCKQCFLKIFGETEQSVRTVCKSKTQDELPGVSQHDMRGKHDPAHKISIEKHNEVLEFINLIPKYQSHYSRRHTKKVYFQRGLNLSTLYTLYRNKISLPVSKSKFEEIFRTLDLKFKKPQLDLCTQCETLKAKIKNNKNDVEKSELSQQLTNHHNDLAYECKRNDKRLSMSDKSVKMCTFDLQQCLPTPYLSASIFFYKRPLWTFNFTIHDGATNKADCYIWHEGIAKRGANDIGSCIYKYLSELPYSVNHVILYSDSCPGQNRNSYVCAVFEKILQDHPSIQTIDHKFLIVGHTHLECDTVHAQIEKKKKNSSGSIQHPHDWANLIAATNKKYVVHELKQDDFYDFQAFLKQNFSWRTNNVTGEKFEWKMVRWMRYEKDKLGILQYKHSHTMEEKFKELNINQRRRKEQTASLTQSYTSDLPISMNKKRDLIEMLPLINENFHNFYQNLKTEGECSIEVDSDLDEIDNDE
ncbi:uncharacterized protein LOC142231355 [Haematobia irritans]|uniref:uncharacterized protein LOC142231355 n=1 Tax=Haematobia irritans TaxID=7368 RepID=UPI003F4FD72E